MGLCRRCLLNRIMDQRGASAEEKAHSKGACQSFHGNPSFPRTRLSGCEIKCTAKPSIVKQMAKGCRRVLYWEAVLKMGPLVVIMGTAARAIVTYNLVAE